MSTEGTAPPWTLRAARPADEDGVRPLAAALATSFVPTREGFARSFAALLADPHTAILVAEADGKIVGYVHVLTHPAFHADGSIGWIEELMVAESERGGGCGRALVAAAEDWAREHADVAYLALATRRAGDFHRAIGYEESATYFKRTFR